MLESLDNSLEYDEDNNMLGMCTHTSVGFYNTWQQYHILSADEEQVLARKLKYEQCVESAKQLVYHNMRFVIFIVSKCCFDARIKEDLVSCGTIGLMKAIKTFDPEMGVRLSSFAVYSIKEEIYNYLIDNSSQLKIATTKDQRKIWHNVKRYLQVDTGLTLQDKEFICEELKVDMTDLNEMLVRMTSAPLLINHSYDDNAEDLEIQGDDCPSMFLEHMDNEKLWQKVRNTVDQLDERSKDIIVNRWINDTKLPLKELSERHKISLERVRQIENESIKKLHKLLT